MTAMVCFFAGSSGRKWFSFLSSTMDSRAARRAIAACSGELTVAIVDLRERDLLRRIEHAELECAR